MNNLDLSSRNEASICMRWAYAAKVVRLVGSSLRMHQGARAEKGSPTARENGPDSFCAPRTSRRHARPKASTLRWSTSHGESGRCDKNA